MSAQKLPSDIITDIISRLPVEPLVRFKSVAKSWYSLINSPKFNKLHLNQTLQSNDFSQLIISHSTSLSTTNIDSTETTILRLSDLEHPLRHLPSHNPVEIDGLCNGIVCITPYDKKYVMLYNPSTKMHHLVPSFATSPKVKPYFDMFNRDNVNLAVFGFGYDGGADDYKVLRMIQNNEHRESSVYSLKNNSWKCVDDHTPMEYRIQIPKAVLVNETLHFPAVKVLENYRLKRIIKCFNLRTNTFSLMEAPTFVEKFHKFDFAMCELDGYFGLMVNHFNLDLDMALGRRLAWADLYVKKGSWVKVLSIDDPQSIGASQLIRPIVYSKDGRRILLELDSLVLIWYDFGSKEIERVTIQGLPSKDGKGQSIYTRTFVGSLVLLRINDKKPQDNTLADQKKNNNDSGKFLSKGFKLRL